MNLQLQKLKNSKREVGQKKQTLVNKIYIPKKVSYTLYCRIQIEP